MEGFFLTHVSLSRSRDVFGVDLMIVPVNTGSHWSVGLLDLRSTTMFYFCSMGWHHANFFRHMKRYLKDEWEHKKAGGETTYSADDWKVVWSEAYPGGVPKQANSDDCGIFAILFVVGILEAYFHAGEALPKFDFSRFRNIRAWRRRILLEIVSGKVFSTQSLRIISAEGVPKDLANNAPPSQQTASSPQQEEGSSLRSSEGKVLHKKVFTPVTSAASSSSAAPPGGQLSAPTAVLHKKAFTPVTSAASSSSTPPPTATGGQLSAPTPAASTTIPKSKVDIKSSLSKNRALVRRLLLERRKQMQDRKMSGKERKEPSNAKAAIGAVGGRQLELDHDANVSTIGAVGRRQLELDHDGAVVGPGAVGGRQWELNHDANVSCLSPGIGVGSCYHPLTASSSPRTGETPASPSSPASAPQLVSGGKRREELAKSPPPNKAPSLKRPREEGPRHGRGGGRNFPTGKTAVARSGMPQTSPRDETRALETEPPSSTRIHKWLCHSSYGLVYVLSDGATVGAYFNDSTKITAARSLDELQNFEYITRRTAHKPAKRRTLSNLESALLVDKDLWKKVTLLQHFDKSLRTLRIVDGFVIRE